MTQDKSNVSTKLMEKLHPDKQVFKVHHMGTGDIHRRCINIENSKNKTDRDNAALHIKCKELANDMYDKYDLVTAAVDDSVRKVVGPNGIQMESVVTDKNGNLLKDVNEQINYHREKLFENLETKNKFNVVETTELIYRMFLLDGESFFRFIPNKNFNDYRFTVDVLDSALISANLNDSKENVVSGFQLDGWRRKLGVHVIKNNKYNPRLGKDTSYYEWPKIFFMQNLKKPSQIRGISKLRQSMQRFSRMRDYEIEFNDQLMIRIGFYLAFQDRAGKSQELTYDEGERRSKNKNDQVVKTGRSQMSSIHVSEGKEVQKIETSYPGPESHEYVNGHYMFACSSLPCTYSSASGNYTKGNYNTRKHERLDAQSIAEHDQNKLIRYFHEPVLNKAFTNKLIASNKIKLPPNVNKKTIHDVNYFTYKQEELDQSKSTNDWINRIKNGNASLNQWIRATNNNPDKVLRSIKESQDMLLKKGLVFDFMHLSNKYPDIVKNIIQEAMSVDHEGTNKNEE